MQFKVSGTNRDTGARMIFECQASNRAMAERKATQSGMGEVLHCEQVRDPNEPVVERRSRRGEPEARSARRLVTVGVVLVLLAVAVVFWPRIRALFGG